MVDISTPNCTLGILNLTFSIFNDFIKYRDRRYRESFAMNPFITENREGKFFLKLMNDLNSLRIDIILRSPGKTSVGPFANPTGQLNQNRYIKLA